MGVSGPVWELVTPPNPPIFRKDFPPKKRFFGGGLPLQKIKKVYKNVGINWDCIYPYSLFNLGGRPALIGFANAADCWRLAPDPAANNLATSPLQAFQLFFADNRETKSFTRTRALQRPNLVCKEKTVFQITNISPPSSAFGHNTITVW